MKRLDSSEIFLILVNIFPIIGMLFFNWTLFSVLMIYWVETGIILFYTIIKRIYIMIKRKKEESSEALTSTIIILPTYLGFMLIHLAVIIALAYPSSVEVQTFSEVFRQFKNEIILMGIMFLISHGQSFYFNSIKNKKLERGKVKEILHNSAGEITTRIGLMQLVAILGWSIIEVIKGPMYLFILFIILKTLIDLNGHRKKYKRNKNLHR